MKPMVKKILENKDKTIPILSFPSTQLLGITVKELLDSPEMQVKGMKAIAERCSIAASLNMMDLSVEAETFGCEIVFKDDDVPTVKKGIIDDIMDAENIVVPTVGMGRTAICIDGIKKAKEEIKDIPVFCGIIGPYSLAGRLFDMTELMMECYDSPDEVKILLSKATEFIINYILEFKKAGADGVVMAEPAAGLLSPSLNAEFSAPFVKEIIEKANDENFVICYHNCGDAIGDMTNEIKEYGADIYHFGNAVSLIKMLPQMPTDTIVMGNIDPVLFTTSTPDKIRENIFLLYEECKDYQNFMISSGCDIPAKAKWENIDAYFDTIKELYS